MENYKDLLKRSILKIQEQDRRIAALQAGIRQPIAIIGASARFPGSPDLERFWNVIDAGADAVSTMTDQRWNMDAFYAEQAGLPGRINTRRFGLLDDVDQFDPSAFGIAEAEAQQIDPQHRILLEQAWFCLERAGLDVGSVKGRDVGVFIGQMNSDYAQLVKDARDLNAYFGIGNALSAAAGRLSYVFGLKGPSISLDTACSSSLVAVHLACQSLRLGECSMALAGGVNLLLSPAAAVGAAVAKMLSATGRCNTFGDAADGYVRSEGCGLVLLKPLAQALTEGDPILAVIRGSAVNQDGRSNGMSAPSGPAQIEVMQRALADAQLNPADVTYIETHGTGTPLGDPVEVQAIDAVYGRAQGRVSSLPLGAVKANIGHCESAAGIAGLIKLVLMLQHQRLPPIAHLNALNPQFEDLSHCVQFPKGQSLPWPGAEPRIGAVSSFGYTGTNAHVIVERYAASVSTPDALTPAVSGPQVLCYSAHSATALHAQLRQTLHRLNDEPDLTLGQLAAAVNRTRNGLPYRLAWAVDSRETLRARLMDGSTHAPYGPTTRPHLVYFCGGSTTASLDCLREPASAAHTDHLDDGLRRVANLSLAALLDGDDAQRTSLKLLCAQYVHACRWQALGVLPHALLGEGRGVLAAAAVAGVLSLEQALELAIALDEGSAQEMQAALARMTFAEGRCPLQAANTRAADSFPYAQRERQAEWLLNVLQQRTPVLKVIDAGQVVIDLLSHHVTVAADDPMPEDASTRQGREASFLDAVAALFQRGVVISGRALADTNVRYLADYPFDRRRYWLAEHVMSRGGAMPTVFGALRHGIFSAVLAEPDGGSLFSGDLSLATLPFLKAHVVHGETLLPASVFVDLLLTASAWQGHRGLRLEQMQILQPCVLGNQPVGVYCRFAAPVGSAVAAEIYTRTGHGPWIHHVSARLAAVPVHARHHDLREVQRHCPSAVSVADHYTTARRAGVMYGPAFQAVRSLARGPGVALATIALPEMLQGEQHQHHLHPVLLDACFQIIAAAAGGHKQADEARLYVPSALQGLNDTGARPGTLKCFVRIHGPQSPSWNSDAELERYLQTRESFTVSITVCDEDGREVLAIERFETMRLRHGAGRGEPWQDWIYERTWIAADGDAASAFAPFDQLVWFARELAQRTFASQENLQRQPSVHPDDLALAYIREAFVQLGVDTGDLSASSSLLVQHGVRGEYTRLCQRFLAAVRTAAPVTHSSHELQARLNAGGVDAVHEIDLIQRCGEALADVLRGTTDPLDLLFGTHATEQAQSVYEDTPGTRALNGLIAAVVEQAVRERRGQGTVRILEVGAGTGATTRQVLERLAGLNVEYVFSDISGHFLNRAQQRFAQHAGVRYRTFDVSADPTAQGFRAGAFDIVIAVNVLHATPDVSRALTHLRACLADGGLMLLRELTRPQLWLDLTFGLTPGWWNFTDHSVRQDGPLLNSTQWQALFQVTGFDAEPLTLTDGEPMETVFLARKQPTSSPRHWVLFSNQDAACHTLHRALEAGGHQVSVVTADLAADARVYHASTDSREHIAELFARIEHEHGPIHAAIYAWGLHSPALDRVERPAALEPFAKVPLLLCQTVLQARWRHVELSFLTGGAQAVGGKVSHPLAALMWGHVFSFVNETGVFARLVDIDTEDFAPAALMDLFDRHDECQWALRGTQRLIVRLLPAAIRESVPVRIRAEATYLITGGYGDLGLQTAQRLADQGARQIILLGRQVRRDSAMVAQLQDRGVRVHHVQADVGDAAALTQALIPLLDSLPPLRGIVHSVGVLEDGIVEQQSWLRYQKVLTPKVLGALHLARIAAGRELDFFIVYSSASGVMGNPGQANHAAANAFLDAFAAHRRGNAYPGLAIGWGAWSQIGAAATEDMATRLMHDQALVGMIPPSHGLAVMARQFAADNAQFCVLPLRAGLRLEAQRQPFVQRLLSGVLKQPATHTPVITAPADPTDLKTQLARHVGPERRALAMAYLQSVVAPLLRHAGAIDPAVSLFEVGLDSLLAIDLRRRLEQDFQQSFESTLLFDYPTLSALATFLLQTLDNDREALPAAPAAKPLATHDAIAVIGMGCRYPGGVSTPAQFWALLSGGGDTATPIPLERWNNADYFDPQKFKPGKIYVSEGCFVDQVDHFYPERYGISGIEAERMDPQQRLLLDVCHEALENAGIAPEEIGGRDVGVFMGVMTQDYLQLAQHVREHPFYVGTGTANSVLAGRVAHVFGLTGPTMTVDTACSSSLVTVQLACLNLRAGSCDMALAGGVSLQLTPQTMVLECAGGMLSPSGRCKTFDADADGFVRGEGCGVVVLKRLSDALEQRDAILGVIRGAAVTHDGRSGGLTVPNGLSQQRVLEKALLDAGIAASNVSYVEAHGTGTSLGDPIELNALQAVFGKERTGTPLWVGSVKTNIGHAEAAAGIAGLQKTLLALQHQRIPAHLHLRRPTPNFNWRDAALAVPQALTAWETSGPRTAGVSSFGLSGTNAHVIVEEYGSRKTPRTIPDGFMPLALLSSISREHLARDAGRYACYLASSGHDIVDVAFTMSTSRASQPVKAILTADSIAQLIANLQALAAGAPGEVVVFDASSQVAPLTLAFDDVAYSPAWAEYSAGYYQDYAAFRDAIDDCVAQLNVHAQVGVDALRFCRGNEATIPAHVRHGVLQVAYARLLLSLGMAPQRVSSVGVGLFCAACVSGMASTGQMLAALLGKDDETLLLTLAGALDRAAAELPVQLPTGSSLPRSVVAAAARALDTAPVMENAAGVGHEHTLHLGTSRVRHEGVVHWTLRLPPLARLLIELVDIGQAIDWTRYFACAQPYKVALPNTAFPSRRYWIPENSDPHVTKRKRIDISDISVASDARRYVEYRLHTDDVDFLREHQVNGAHLLPAASVLAFALHAMADQIVRGAVQIENLSLARSVFFDASVTVQLALSVEDAQMHVVTDASASWQLFASLGRMGRWEGEINSSLIAHARQRVRELTAPEQPTIDRDAFYSEHLPDALTLGDSYRRVRQVWCTHDAAVARIDNLVGDLAVDMRALDACMQAVNSIDQVMEAHPDDLFLPASLEAFRLVRWPVSAQFWCLVEYQQALSNSSNLIYNLTVLDDDGQVCAQFHHVGYRKVTPNVGRSARPATDRLPAPSSGPTVVNLALLSATELTAHVAAAICEKLAAFLKIDAQSIAHEKAFFDMGMDSITAVEFSGDLNDLFGLDLHVDAVFDYPSVSSLVPHICHQLGAAGTDTSAAAPANPPASTEELTELLKLELDC